MSYEKRFVSTVSDRSDMIQRQLQKKEDIVIALSSSSHTNRPYAQATDGRGQKSNRPKPIVYKTNNANRPLQRKRAACGIGRSVQEVLLSQPGVIDGAKLSLVGNRISLIDKIPPRVAGSIKIVYLSNNDIRHIDEIAQFTNCHTLSLANNLIKFLGDISCLGKMEFLEKLTLEGNDVTGMPYFRDYVLGLCPRLSIVDGIKVSVEERLAARNKARKVASVFEQLRINELRLQILYHYALLSKCHAELSRVVCGQFR